MSDDLSRDEALQVVGMVNMLANAGVIGPYEVVQTRQVRRCAYRKAVKARWSSIKDAEHEARMVRDGLIPVPRNYAPLRTIVG